MVFLFGIYVIMDVGILFELLGRKFKEVFDCVLRLKEIRECFFMFVFVVDKNIYCGRKCVDIIEKFLNVFLKISCFLFKEDIFVKYYFIEVSYGKSFYDVK